MVLPEDQAIGPYRIVEQIGQGGMATVYRAYHDRLDRHVAIKMMHKSFLDDQDFLARFTREAQIVAKLEHPNIVPIYDFSEYEGQPYLVMKEIKGRSLKSRLYKSALSLAEILHIMGTVAAALDYAHKQGILHRDIKPSNIVLDVNDVPYLTDFGLARIMQSGATTMSAEVMLGTPHYISPEQASGLTDLDARTDLYSLGIVLYELVVGQVPFNADTPYAIVHDHIYSPVPMPRQVNPEIPDEIEEVLLKALSKDPNERYNTAKEMMDDFAKAVEAVGLNELHPDRISSAAISLSRIREQLHKDMRSQQDIVTPALKSAAAPRKPKVDIEEDTESAVISAPGPIRPPRRPKPPKSPVPPQFRRANPDVEFDFAEMGQKFESTMKRVATWGGTVAEKIEEKIEEEKSKSRGRRQPTEEEIIRRRVEKRIEAWNGFRTHLIVFLLVNLLLWAIWATAGDVISTLPISEEAVNTIGDINGIVPWPLFITLIWGLGVMGHWSGYYNKHGRAAQKREEAVQREIERSRRIRRRVREEEYEPKQKARGRGKGVTLESEVVVTTRGRGRRRGRRGRRDYHDDRDYYSDDEASTASMPKSPAVRLTDEGELTDSFVEETDEFEERGSQ